ncbi:hypothetical protein [Hyphomonas sp.]|uniref:hypothetical protein n=1 Tax=Hyphomonas sp. TaxID=87 RepID=UPI0025C4AB15|nr:hypothetical protein [Hyphomonas sp.]
MRGGLRRSSPGAALRQHLRQSDKITIDLEDPDAVVSLTDKLSFIGATVRVCLKPRQLYADALALRQQLEIFTGKILRQLASWLDDASQFTHKAVERPPTYQN